jgi:hypothetical protein
MKINNKDIEKLSFYVKDSVYGPSMNLVHKSVCWKNVASKVEVDVWDVVRGFLGENIIDVVDGGLDETN